MSHVNNKTNVSRHQSWSLKKRAPRPSPRPAKVETVTRLPPRTVSAAVHLAGMPQKIGVAQHPRGLIPAANGLAEFYRTASRGNYFAVS